MAIKQDLHVHTTWCDGRDTPERLIKAAIEAGIPRLGLVAHAYTWFDESYCLQQQDIPLFISDVRSCASRYRSKIEVLCGLEKDFFSEQDIAPFDYVIGGCHYLEVNGEYYAIDDSREQFEEIGLDVFGGDYLAMAEKYYAQMGEVVRKVGADCIAHFDLIAKYNEDGRYFNEADSRYVAAYTKAVERLIPYGKPFEVNYGAITRGVRTTPYPNNAIQWLIKERGGRMCYASDSHSAEALVTNWEEFGMTIHF